MHTNRRNLSLLVFVGACSVFEPLHNQPDTSVVVAPDTACEGAIRINEVDGATTGSGSDREFIEITNTSDENVNIGGIVITRSRGTGPDVGKGRSVPDGYLLAPSAFLYVLANVSNAEDDLQFDDCIDAAPTPCLHVSWDINADGESLYLLTRTLDEILCEYEYPRTVAAGDSWGRVPDGANTARATLPTPGGPNRVR